MYLVVLVLILGPASSESDITVINDITVVKYFLYKRVLDKENSFIIKCYFHFF